MNAHITAKIEEAGFEPRDYQIRIIKKTHAAFTTEGYKSVMIESPTGSGKTSIALILLKLLEEQDPSISIAWVAMRRKLLAQAANENKKVGVKNIKFISMFDNHPPKADFMVADEGHHSAARTCAELFDKMGIKRWCALSATPYRTDRVQLCFEKIISDCGVRYLIEQGYLSPFDQYAIPKWTPKIVANHFLTDPEKWGKSIIFMKDQYLCYELQSYLLHGGIMADVILGTDSPSRREEIYNSFENGESQVLINVYLLTEGFDCCDLKSVWVRDSCKLCTMQMSGRVLRKDPNNPNKVAQIIQSEQTPFPYSKVAKPRTQHIWDEDRWLSLEPGANVSRILRLIRKKVLSKPVQLPAYLEDRSNKITSISVDSRGHVNYRRSRPTRRDYI